MTAPGNGRRRIEDPEESWDQSAAEVELEQRFLASIDQGRRRMSRGLVALLATGGVGGIDVGMGVLALLLVESKTKTQLLGGVAFSIGFVILTFASSELFTENFLIPVTTVLSRKGPLRGLLRLWAGTLGANLAAGWVFVWFVMRGLPELGATARTAGDYYATLSPGLRSFALAVLGGATITLMTWMQQGTESMTSRAIPAVVAGFVLAAARLDHAIVASLVMFSALIAGHASFGYLQWGINAGWAAMGNIIGGVAFVTLLRVLQVPHKLRDEQRRPAPGVPIADRRNAGVK